MLFIFLSAGAEENKNEWEGVKSARKTARKTDHITHKSAPKS